MAAAIFSIFIILAIAGVCAVVIIKNMLYICQPNEVLIFSGARRRGPDGRILGYRIVKGGRGMRIPLFERVHKMDLTNMAIDVAVSGAFSKGGIPLNVQGVANVKVAGTEPTLPIFIWNQLRFPQKLPGVLALGACILVVSFVVVCFSQWLRRRGGAELSDTGI